LKKPRLEPSLPESVLKKPTLEPSLPELKKPTSPSPGPEL
jgi:hypothetical protein